MNYAKFSAILGVLGPAMLVGCSGADDAQRQPGTDAPSAGQSTDFGEVAATSTHDANRGITTRLVSKTSGAELATLEWSADGRVRYDIAGVKHSEAQGHEGTVAALELEQANALLHELWARESKAATPPGGGEKAYTTCTPTVTCGYFNNWGMTCYACTGVDMDCNTGTVFNCWA